MVRCTCTCIGTVVGTTRVDTDVDNSNEDCIASTVFRDWWVSCVKRHVVVPGRLHRQLRFCGKLYN
jgi:hypothetical protein